MKLSRPVLATLLPPAVLLVAAFAWPLIAYLVCKQDTLAAGYEGWFLWLVARYHERELVLCVLPLVAMLLFVPMAWRGAASLLHLALGAFGCAVVFMEAVYVVVFRLWRVSPWPWASAVLCAVAVYVWLRLCWAYLPLQVAYRTVLRSYLRADPRAESYFRLLARLRDGGGEDAFEGRRQVVGSSFWARPFQVLFGALRAAGATGFSARVLRFVAPRVPPKPLAIQDRLLVTELEFLRDDTWAELERELYGAPDGGEYADVPVPELDGVLQRRVRALFARWLAYTDALAECHAFGLIERVRSGRSLLGEDQDESKEHLRIAADLLSDAAARAELPTVRKTGDEHFLLAERADGIRFADRLLMQASDCLAAAVGDRARILCGDRAGTPNDRMEARLTLCFLRAQREEWHASDPGLEDALRRHCEEAGQALAGKTAPLEPSEFRSRYFEWLLLSGPMQQMRDVIAATRAAVDAASKPAWWRKERWLGAIYRIKTGGGRVDQLAVKSEMLRSAREELIHAGHAALRTLREFFPPNAPELEAKDPALHAVDPPQRPASPPAVAWTELHGGADSWRTPSRAPNCFTRVALAGASAAAFVLLFTVMLAGQAGGIVPVPDLRVASRALAAPGAVVHSICPGREPDPSLWVASKDGVHVKAGGTLHHWNRITAAPHELQTNDVRRVDVGRSRVAFVCAEGAKRGVSLVGAPTLPVGSRPWLGVTGWRTLIGLSSFAGVTDERVTAIAETGDASIALFGTRGAGLGRYVPLERRWLDQPTIDEQHGFLAAGSGSIHDVAVVSAGDRWLAWVGTDRGLAGGPVGSAADATPVPADSWLRVEAPLVGPVVSRVDARRRGPASYVDYHTDPGGSGRITAGDDRSVAQRVVVGASSVPGLEEETLRHAAYDGEAKRLWFHDVRSPAGEPRFSVYREASHEWQTQPEGELFTGRSVFDLQVDRGHARQALAGLSGGVAILADDDSGVRSRLFALDGQNALAVAPGTGACGVAVFTRALDGHAPAIRHIAADAALLDAPSKTAAVADVIGPRRMPGLELADITVVEADRDDASLFLGTRRGALGYLDAGQRQVYRLEPLQDTEEASPVRDLAFVGPNHLFRVRGDGLLDLVELDPDAPGRAVASVTTVNDTAGQVGAPTTIAALEERLFLGSARALSLYDMSKHRWAEVGAVKDLIALHESARRIWAETGPAARRLSLLEEQGGAFQWAEPFGDRRIHAFDAAESAMIVIDQAGAVRLHDGTKASELLAPAPLGKVERHPTCAAASGTTLFLAPVNGAIARYDLESKRWSSVPLPEEATGVAELRIAPRVLWLLDPKGGLFAASAAAGWNQLDWFPRIASGINAFFVGTSSTLARQEDGQVLRVDVDGGVDKQTLVGPATKLDPSLATAVVKHKERWYFAVKQKLLRYNPEEHSWDELEPSGQPIVRLIATRDHLYVLDARQALLRLDDSAFKALAAPLDKVSWVDVFSAPKGGKPDSIGLGTEAGVFVVNDKRPNVPDPLQARSSGPPKDATITCAVEIGDELYLGTAEHGLWGYVRDSALAKSLLRWRRLEVRDQKQIQGLVRSPDNTALLAALTPAGVVVLRRKDLTWSAPQQVGGDSAAVAGDDVYVARTGSTTADTGLLRLRKEVSNKLIDLANPHGNFATRSIAVDPETGDLLRADAQETVARYRVALRGWVDEPIGDAGAKIRDVFVSNGTLWAWSSQEQALFRREAQRWKLFEPAGSGSATTQVVWDREGVVLRTASRARPTEGEELWLVQGQARRLLPASARHAGAELDDSTAIAELGRWLLLASRSAGLRAYDRVEHSWTAAAEKAGPGAKASEARIELWQPVFDGSTLKSLWALGSDHGLYRVHAANAPQYERVQLPGQELAAALFREDGRVQVLSVGGKVMELGTAVAAASIEPQPLRGSIGEIHAAHEFQEQLYLAFQAKAGTAATGDSIACYDARTLAWRSCGVPGKVERFLEIQAPEPLLLAVVLVEGEASDPPRALFKVQPARTELLANSLYDVTSDGQTVWVIDRDRRLRPLAKGLQKLGEPVGGIDRLQKRMFQALPVGDQIIAWQEDGSLWSYSLATLTWSQAFGPGTIDALVEVGGTPYAIGREMPPTIRGFFGNAWTAIQGIRLESDPKAPVPLWQIAPGPALQWRLGPQSPFAPVGFKEGRLAFNVMQRVAWHGGLLWAMTDAKRSDGVEVVHCFGQGLKRDGDPLRHPAAAIRAAFVPPPAIAFAGTRFRVASAANGPWSGHDLFLRLDDANRSEVPVAPRQEGDATWLDIDRWLDADAGEKTLVAVTPRGLLSVERDPRVAKGVRRLAFTPRSDAFAGFGRTDAGGLLAKLGQDHIVYEEASLAWSPAPRARGEFERSRSLLRYASLLRTFKLNGEPGKIELALVQGQKEVPITLSKGGFEFDRAVALGLRREAVELYTQDGCVLRDRTDRGSFEILPQTRLPDSVASPMRTVAAPGAVILVKDGHGVPNEGYQLAGPDLWPALEPRAIEAAVSAQKELCNDRGWIWSRDGSVSAKLAGMELQGCYDTLRGRFTFDQVLALAASGSDLWVATRVDLQTWRAGAMVSAQRLVDGCEGASSAAFVRSLDGQWFLELQTRDGTQLFVHANGAWQAVAPGNVAAAQEKITQARATLVHGDAWRITRDDADQRSATLAPYWDRVRLDPDGVWDFEQSTCLAGESGKPCLGSKAGLTLLDVATGRREFARTAAPVERLAPEGQGYHVRLATGQEAVYQGAPLRAGPPPSETFETKDRTLIDSERLRVEKSAPASGSGGGGGGQASIFVRPSHGAALAPTFVRAAIVDGRFDFDQVLALGLMDDGVPILATRHENGVLLRGSDKELFEVPDGLTQPGTAEQARILQVWRQGGTECFVQVAPEAVHRAAPPWQKLDPQETSDVLGLAETQVAEDGTWAVERASVGSGAPLAYTLKLARPEPLEFLLTRGAFSCDAFEDVLLTGASEFLLATEGGVCRYERATGGPARLKELWASPAGASAIEHVVALERTDAGPVARLQAGPFALLQEGRWQLVVAQQAVGWIQAQQARVHVDPERWTVHRETSGFRIDWQGEPAMLIEEHGTRFAHDVVQAAERLDGELWLATSGGIVRYTVHPRSGGLAPASKRHLQSLEFEEVARRSFAPFALHTADPRGTPALVLRTLRGVGVEDRWRWNPGAARWEPIALGAPGEHDVLHAVPEFWTWRLGTNQGVTVDLDPVRFRLSAPGTRTPLFVNGTLSWWDLTPARTVPLAFDTDWFIATSAGVLRLAGADHRKTVCVYQRTGPEDGEALPALADLAVVDGSLVAWSSDEDGSYRFDAAKETWSKELPQPPDMAPIAGRLPQQAAWLNVTFPGPEEVRVRLSSMATDDSDWFSELSPISGGRFLFDRGFDLAWADEHFLFPTSIGLARLEEEGGGLRLFRRELVEPSEALRVHVAEAGRSPRFLEPGGRVLRFGANGEFLEPDPDALRWVAEHEVRAANDLFVARTGRESNHSIELRVGEFPRFELDSSTQLLQDGVFGFDDVRDAKLVGDDELLLSTRLGVWAYDLGNSGPVGLPMAARYWADAGGQRVPMNDLRAFVHDPARVDACIVQGSADAAGFERQQDRSWAAVAFPSVRVDSRSFTDERGEWNLSRWSGGLHVELTRETRSCAEDWEAVTQELGPMDSAFATPSSIWLSLNGGALWVRKGKFSL